MNCQDISLALDDRDIGALNEAQRREFDAHLASCPDCAQDWRIHQRMMATPTPPMPAGLVAQVRTLAAARHGFRNGRRAPNRLVLLGTVLMVAAAAAVLVMQLLGTPARPVTTVASQPAPASGTAAPAPADATPTPSADATGLEPAIEPAPDKDALPEIKPFTVRVLPLKNEARDVTGSSIAVSMYAAFMERLRAVPGVTLLDDGDAATLPSYQVTLSAFSSGNKFTAEVGAETFKPDGSLNSNFYMGASGDLPASCTSHLPIDAFDSSCADAEGIAINLLGALRKVKFQPDPALQRQLQARLLDKSLDAKQRQAALTDLAMLGFAYSGRVQMDDLLARARRDPVLLRGAVDLATNAAEPVRRAQAWNTLRGAEAAALVKPLLGALRKEQDREVRLAVLGVMAGGYLKNEQVHAMLEASAQHEKDPLLRAVAQRALAGAGGDAPWRQYILDSLKDSSRPSEERIEALLYHLNLPTSEASSLVGRLASQPNLRLLLDAEAIPALAAALQGISSDSAMLKSSVSNVARDLSQIDHPAITDMYLASLEADGKWLDRYSAASSLGQMASRRNDPRVRAVLEKIRTEDPDKDVRRAAEEALNKVGTAGPLADRPRLGVRMDVVKPGEAAPPELVGKVAVIDMSPDSVAQRAGMKIGDVVLEINGSPLLSAAQSIKVLDGLPRGVDVEILVERSGQRLSLTARF